MEALILAAGEGVRLRPLTNSLPKTMVPFNGRPILLRQLDVLRAKGISDVSVVGGYQAEALPGDKVRVFENMHYASTNMVFSMFQADTVFAAGQDILVVYGDILFGEDCLQAMLNTPGNIVVGVNMEWRKLWESRFDNALSDAETMVLDGDQITELGKKAKTMEEIQGQFTGLIKFSAKAAEEIWERWGQSAFNDPENSPVSKLYMTDFIQNLIDNGKRVTAAFIYGDWLEVDSVEDLELYEKLLQKAALSDISSLDAPYRTE